MSESASSRVGRCPVCGYSLRGLPASHRCPECAFEYDEDTRIWRPLNPKAIFGQAAGMLGGLGGLSHFVIRWPSLPAIPRALVLLGVVVWAVVLVAILRHVYRVYRRGQFISLGPEGVHYRMQTADAQVVPWSDVEAVRPQRYDRACRLIRTDGRREVVLVGVFKSSQDVMQFVQLAEQRLKTAREAIAD